jgi:ParB-like chromosome segregation protein Spo0J
VSTPRDWPLDELRPHPANDYFDEPEDCEEFEALVSSIRTDGLFHPITVSPDGMILGGHLRVAAFRKLGRKSIPAVTREVPTYRDGLVFLIKDNATRRQLSKAQIAHLYAELRKTPKAEGGTAKKRGAPTKKERRNDSEDLAASNLPQSRHIHPAADEAAELLNVTRAEADRLETVFTTPNVPDVVRDSRTT